ncbi:MAG: NAD-dependent epimerase/dehydratase family protein [Rhodospirillaceae bacterium]|nr:NAD-dependent epimerase/dehydratase family protein [Rhodospirillales bacterium]
MTKKLWNVLVTGGAGYVGSVLIPKLLAEGHRVTVLDLYLYGEDLFAEYRSNPNLIEVKGDMRDPAVVAKAMEGCNAVIHLACISNDPSFELNPDLGKSINFDAFRPLVKAAKKVGATRFIYASSSSVYGIKSDPQVTEDLPLDPLTDYSKFKMMCEEVLEEEREPGFHTLTIRPATVCGYGPRQRLDVIVNILTNHAVNNGRMKVFGGSQLRPNIHIGDMTDLYLLCLQLPGEQIDGKIYNAGYENHSLMQLAEMTRSVVGDVAIDVEETNDLRSYQVSSAKITRELGFTPKHTIEDAVRDLKAAFDAGKFQDPMNNPMYYNIKRMQQVKLA